MSQSGVIYGFIIYLSTSVLLNIFFNIIIFVFSISVVCFQNKNLFQSIKNVIWRTFFISRAIKHMCIIYFNFTVFVREQVYKFKSFPQGVFCNFSISLLSNEKEKYTKLLFTKYKNNLIVLKRNQVYPQTLIYFKNNKKVNYVFYTLNGLFLIASVLQKFTNFKKR